AARKTAIVTGGGGGGARGAVSLPVSRGYCVGRVGLNENGGRQMGAGDGGGGIAAPRELTGFWGLARGGGPSRPTIGTVDLLCNNAGVTTTGPFTSVDAASIPRDIGINLIAPLHIIHTVAPWMRAPGGAIVNTISLASIAPLAGSSVYSATKFGLRGFNI